MKNSWKAALISALVFPGLGEIWLGRYLRGLGFIVATAAASAAVIVKASRQAFDLLNRIEAEGGNVDVYAILRSVTATSATTPDAGMTLAAVAVLFCWGISVLDAYLLGRKKDQARQRKDAAKVRNGNREG
jgi:hypothetical protein